MGIVHLTSEELSALLDAELEPTAELRARQHLVECASCAAEYAFSVRLDAELRQPPVLSCGSVLELLSASHDRQADEAEQAAARRHFATCGDCRLMVQNWVAVTESLRALPAAMPSARVDGAIRDLVYPRRAPRAAPRTTPLPGLAARGLIVVTAVVAIVVAGLTSGTRAPTIALPALPTYAPERVLVAAMQQAVFNPNNNTLYVLDVAGAAVDAREPATNDLKARIAVGGEPTALALYESANTILVLDASQKRVTEIDAASNTVIGATTVAVTGTPTSISVDPNAGKILVTTVSTPSSPAEKSPAGAVAVINGTTKQLETVREIEVAPRLVVPDPNRSRTALVSANATTIVDSSYKVIETLPGGVSAAFSRRGEFIAVLSASGTGSVLRFIGLDSPADVKFDGSPRAMTALPDGGYLVFVVGGDLGRVSRIGQDGTLVGSVEIAITNGDLLYDQGTNRFTVASAGRLFSAEMPTQVVAAATQSASPAPSDTSSPAAASPSTPPTIATARTPEPSVAPASPNANLLTQAHPLGGNLHTLPLPNGIQPEFVTTTGSRLWILDQADGVHSFDTATGDLYSFGKLRGGAHVGFWVASPLFVFGVDATNGEVNVVDVIRQRIDAYATNVLSPVSAVAVGLDSRLWIGLRDAPYLLVFDPTTRLMRSIDLQGAKISALTIDSVGRVLYADDFRGTVGVIDQTTKLLNEVGFAKRGTTTALLVDNNSTLWLGTSAGEVYSVRGGTARLAVSLQRPVTSFAVDRAGRTWYLAPLPSGFGYIYAPADGSQAARSVPGPVISLSFNVLGRALLADPRGGIYMSTEAAQ
jgi:streptogramin lyase/anti-sigma factor RsiW